VVLLKLHHNHFLLSIQMGTRSPAFKFGGHFSVPKSVQVQGCLAHYISCITITVDTITSCHCTLIVILCMQIPLSFWKEVFYYSKYNYLCSLVNIILNESLWFSGLLHHCNLVVGYQRLLYPSPFSYPAFMNIHFPFTTHLNPKDGGITVL
jgi:hypothetical protein